MSNHKMQFPSHISKSWFSVCIFIFLLTVCVGLAIHVTSEEDAICSDSDHFMPSMERPLLQRISMMQMGSLVCCQK